MGCDNYFATPSPAIPTPMPSPAPFATMAPSAFVAPPGSTLQPAAAPVPASQPVVTSPTTASPTVEVYVDVNATFPPSPSPATRLPTSSPVVVPAIRVNIETTAREWCPRIPLSDCTVDLDGIASGDVRSLHASFYVGLSSRISACTACCRTGCSHLRRALRFK